jgi:hypothetical protein
MAARVEDLVGPDGFSVPVEDVHVQVSLAVRRERRQVLDARTGAVGKPDPGVAHDAVAIGRRAVVQGSEVAVPVDERDAHRERLRHPHERVVDRAVTVRVQLAHDVADDPPALHVTAVGPQAHVVHRVQDPALHRLQAVARVGEGTRVDDRVRVLEERALHLLLDVDVDDALGEVLGRRRRRGTAGHGRIVPPVGCVRAHRPPFGVLTRRSSRRGVEVRQRADCCE